MKDTLFKWFIVLLIFVLFVLLFLIFKIFYNEYSTDKEIKRLIKKTDISEITTGELIGIDDNIDSNYWKYVNEKSINVNFDNLKKLNEDITGWIKIEGTKVNYPYVKAKDNEYYLNHTINKKSNHIGWTFEDSNIDDRNNNIILYNYSDKTMLADSKEVLNDKWFKKSKHIIKTSTLFENDLWQIFSIYETKNISDIKVKYENLTDYIKPMVEKSIYNFDVNVDNTIKIITIITRQNKEYVVIHAKMIKQQKR